MTNVLATNINRISSVLWIFFSSSSPHYKSTDDWSVHIWHGSMHAAGRQSGTLAESAGDEILIENIERFSQMLASFNQTLPSRIWFMYCNRSMGAEYYTTDDAMLGAKRKKTISANAFTLDQWECTDFQRLSTSTQCPHAQTRLTHSHIHSAEWMLGTIRRMTRQVFFLSILIDLISQHLLIDWQMLPKFDLCVYYMCCVPKKKPNARRKKYTKWKTELYYVSSFNWSPSCVSAVAVGVSHSSQSERAYDLQVYDGLFQNDTY